MASIDLSSASTRIPEADVGKKNENNEVEQCMDERSIDYEWCKEKEHLHKDILQLKEKNRVIFSLQFVGIRFGKLGWALLIWASP